MKVEAIKKCEGVLSVIWISLGLVCFAVRPDHLRISSLAVRFLLVFVVWCGVGLLFAVSGLRSGSRFSALVFGVFSG